MHRSTVRVSPLRKLGWLALAAFTIKGVATTSLIIWALVTAAH